MRRVSTRRISNIDLKRGARTVTAVAAALLVVGYALWPISIVTLESEGTVVKVLAVPDRVELFLDYQHSVIREPVREAFIVSRSGGFLLTRTEHGSFGAGLPTEEYGEFRHDGDVYSISGINRSLAEIPLRVTEGSQQRLSVQGSSGIVFLDFFEASSLVTIKSRRLPRAGYILWRERFPIHE